ncbi:lipopolysaccharide heptosyltransferase II [Motiliproteus sp. SC1-56]|uniref:lipopolysaccharide heptosyltransferase II n=1 Tax=Motiliproteus sp. SC1-56 TaxID=2799565 RepID=UPI001A8C7F9D|nr:lipopolysaccharide heptosyltransferase II [Motiliproteus sp. SC1-56]
MGKRYLVVGPSWVGDMVMTQSLFKRLKNESPGCAIDVVAPAWSHPILARMPEVREAIALDVKHGEFGWKKRFALGKQLRGGYDHSIVIPRSWKSALVPYVAEVPERTAYRGEMRYLLVNDMRLLDKQRLPLAVQRFVALGGAPSLKPPAIPSPELEVDAANQQRFLEEHGIDRDRPVIALLPGAEFGPAKQWPTACWARAAEALYRRGFQLWCLGSPKDSEVAEAIQAEADCPILNFCGRTRLEDAVDLLALAEHAISNDSGLMHVAAAVGTHVVAIYRTTTPDYTPPLTDNADILRADLGGDESLMGVRELPEGHGLKDVPVDQVLDCIGSNTA